MGATGWHDFNASSGPRHRRPPLLRSIGRALRGRCPNCGVGRIMKSWFTIDERCTACGLRFERGRDDEHDYWLGAYTLNFILTEIVFALASRSWQPGPIPRGG